MDQDFINEEQYEEGLTLKKVGYFFKKSWLRMLVYVVAVVLLTTAVAVPIKVFYKSEPIASTSIEFIYDGIENGLAPDGSAFDTNTIISTKVLSEAVAAAELGRTITDISKLREKMRVEGEDTEEYRRLVQAAADGDAEAAATLLTYTMFPTRFNIIISDPKGLGLSDDQAKLLLNKVVEKYYGEFQKRYSLVDMFSADAYRLSENENMEFFDIFDTYSAILDEIDSYLDIIYRDDPSFTSFATSTTLTQLISESKLLRNQYDQFNGFIVAQNVWHNKKIAKDTLNNSIARLESRITTLDSTIESLQAQIDKYQPNTEIKETPTGSNIITTTYPSGYYTLQSRLTQAIEDRKTFSNQKADLDTRIALLSQIEPATEEQYKQQAKEMVVSFENLSREYVNKVNAVVEDYYNTTMISSSVRQVLPPAVTRRTAGFSLLIIYLVAVIAGLLVAGIVTGVKISHANTLNAAVAEKTEKTEKTSAATEEIKTEDK